MTPWRCTVCGRLLAQVCMPAGSILAIKCHRCGTVNVREVVSVEQRVAERPLALAEIALTT